MKPRIALTGATGALGLQVLSELTTRDVDLVVVLRDSSRLTIAAALEIVRTDFARPPHDLYEKLGRPDTIIHMAWGGLPHYSSRIHFEQELPLHYHFLSNLVRSGLNNVVIPGTCLEYGLTSGLLDEDTPPRPTTPYGFAKDALRRQLEFLQQDERFHLTWARLFYMTGEGQRPSALFSQLRVAVERGDEEFPMSPGDQIRDFLPVSDVAYYLVELALLHQDVGIVNVCSGNPTSVKSEVERWLQAQQRTIRLKLGHYPYPSYEPREFWGSPQKLRLLLRSHREEPNE